MYFSKIALAMAVTLTASGVTNAEETPQEP